MSSKLTSSKPKEYITLRKLALSLNNSYPKKLQTTKMDVDKHMESKQNKRKKKEFDSSTRSVSKDQNIDNIDFESYLVIHENKSELEDPKSLNLNVESQKKQIDTTKSSNNNLTGQICHKKFEVNRGINIDKVLLEENDECVLQKGREAPEMVEKMLSEVSYQKRENFKKNFSMFEDWRIIESVDHLIETLDLQANRVSTSQFCDLIDPKTGVKLLNGQREDKSIIERYKRRLKFMTEDNKKQLREFSEGATEEEMKRHFCLFRKLNSRMIFAKISNKPFLENTQGKRRAVHKMLQTNHGENKEGQEILSSDEIGRITNNVQEEDESKETRRTEEIKDNTDGIKTIEVYNNTCTKDRRAIHSSTDFTERQIFADNQVYGETSEHVDCIQEVGSIKKLVVARNPKVRNTTLRTMSHEVMEKDYLASFPWLTKKVKTSPASKSNLILNEDANLSQHLKEKRSEGSKTENYKQDSTQSISKLQIRKKLNFESLTKDMEKFEQKNKMISTQRLKTHTDINFNICICVDYDQESRKFVREEIQSAFPNSEDQLEQPKLSNIANKYEISMNEALRFFNATSSSYDDLEEYLQTKNTDILWDIEDDYQIIQNNPTVLRYLKKIKGEDRVEKRKKYLLQEL